MNNIIVNSEMVAPLKEGDISVLSLGGFGASAGEEESAPALSSSAFIRVRLRFHCDLCGLCASGASWDFASKQIAYQTECLNANPGIRTGRNSLKTNEGGRL